MIASAVRNEVFGHAHVGEAPKEGDIIYCRDKNGVEKMSVVEDFHQLCSGEYYMRLGDNALAGCEGCLCFCR